MKYSDLIKVSDALQSKKILELSNELSVAIYDDLPKVKIASIIREQSDKRVTDTLILEYISIAQSQEFTIDPIVLEIRKLNRADILIEGRLHYKLNDGNVIVITEETQELLNVLYKDHLDVLEFVRESKENFMSILEKLEAK